VSLFMCLAFKNVLELNPAIGSFVGTHLYCSCWVNSAFYSLWDVKVSVSI